MTITGDTEWEYFALWEAMRKLFNCQQKENENIAVYRKRFEEAAKGVAAMTGESLLDRFAGKTHEYGTLTDDNEKKKFKKETWERFLANGLIYNSDRAKYQSRIDTMTAQYTLKHLDYQQRCTFPTTIQNAAEVLNQHKHDNRKKRNGNNDKKGKSKQSNTK